MVETITISKPVLANGREWVDSHNHIRGINNRLELIRNDPSLSEHNKNILSEYCRSMAKKSPATIIKNMQVVHKFLKDIGKDMGDSITKEDSDEYYLNLINNPDLKPWTLKKYLLCIRRFFRVHYGLKTGRYPDQVDHWDTNIDTKQYLDPDLLPTQMQIKDAIESCNNMGNLLESRNQLLIAMLNDLGCRIAELLAVNVGDIKEINHDGLDLFLVKFSQSKTFPRTVVSLLSRPYLKKCFALRGITKDTISEKANEPLFLDRNKKRMEYRAVTKFVSRAFARINYKFPHYKNVHLLRHCWITRAGEYFKFAQKNYWCGQSGGHVSSIYTHFNWKNVVKPYLEMIVGEKNPMLLIKCSACGFENSGKEFCVKCGSNLTEINAVNKDNAVQVFKNFAQNMTQEEFDKYLLRLINKNRGFT
ncbi:MAG: hypothetical protein CL944_00355 [Candidatus Diapherotrites archaeon]|uniref:Tyr recombinase domain-containing protein n=1 Tax=Candidatus Iainarchaeum sp. TaxID=3101447 RepID=A0A2D6LP02_9ARCH|nr:hypothetical protein [Candidatus Diapherotrites archaeon]